MVDRKILLCTLFSELTMKPCKISGASPEECVFAYICYAPVWETCHGLCTCVKHVRFLSIVENGANSITPKCTFPKVSATFKHSTSQSFYNMTPCLTRLLPLCCHLMMPYLWTGLEYDRHSGRSVFVSSFQEHTILWVLWEHTLPTLSVQDV